MNAKKKTNQILKKKINKLGELIFQKNNFDQSRKLAHQVAIDCLESVVSEFVKTRSDGEGGLVDRGYTTASPWPAAFAPVDLDPVVWGRKLYPPPGVGAGPGRAMGPGGLMFGLHHHQDAAAAGLHHHHHHHQPRGPVTSLKEEPLSSSQLAAARSWMQPSVVDQTR